MRKDKEGATFEYDRAWLDHPNRFSLEPALKVGPGPFYTGTDMPMFGAIGDSAPDRWGRTLMRRMERRRAEREGQTPRTLHEIDYLLLVDDEARVGALRFAEQQGGAFLRPQGAGRIPPLVELPKLLSAVEHVVDDTDSQAVRPDNLIASSVTVWAESFCLYLKALLGRQVMRQPLEGGRVTILSFRERRIGRTMPTVPTT